MYKGIITPNFIVYLNIEVGSGFVYRQLLKQLTNERKTLHQV